MEKGKQKHCLWRRGRTRGWCRKTIDATNSYRELCGGCSRYNNEKDILIEKAKGKEGKTKKIGKG